MKFEEIKGMTKPELKKKKQLVSGQLFELKMKNTLGQVSNPIEIRTLRKDLARIETAMTVLKRKG